MPQTNQQPNANNANNAQAVSQIANSRPKHWLNPKLTFAILFTLLLAVSGLFVYEHYFFKQNNLVQCSKHTISQIMEQIRAGSTVDAIEKKEFKITGFYIDKENAQLEGRDKQKADKFGWQDFIEGYEPPTPLLGLKGNFQYGDFIEIKVDRYISDDSTGDKLAIQVAAVRKLGLPTEHDFSKNANQIFQANEKAIFSCANSKPSDFTPINYLAKPSVIWNADKQQAIVLYSKTKTRDRFLFLEGFFQVVNVVVIIDRNGIPISVLVSSHTTPGD